MAPGAGREAEVGGGWAVRVAAGGVRADYPVVVQRGLLASLDRLVPRYAPAHRYAVIADETVAGLYGGSVRDRLSAGGRSVGLLTFPAGERQKTRASWARLTDALLDGGFGRDSAVVALGGGVTGDLAGFVAATFLRGVPVVQVPTSLVAMIDASVGGKTGVDTSAGKNLVGAFHPPRLVAADPEVVGTLPRAERAQGLAEAVKHGAILDAAYLDLLAEEAAVLLEGDPGAIERVVRRSVELKADVVSGDEREGGLRQILNFGHTLGHALEAATGYRLPHGSSVSVGMVLEARLGEALGVTEAGTASRLGAALSALELPTEVPDGTAAALLLEFTRADKKRRAGRPRWVLLRRL
ncbi:MAG TPA: 3-dehydroquinate synthase, partial [Longimicrobiales bacterium]|nr:3-dehydroquinate synthase [Longimicrobiales bacterium]